MQYAVQFPLHKKTSPTLWHAREVWFSVVYPKMEFSARMRFSAQVLHKKFEHHGSQVYGCVLTLIDSM